MPLCGEESMHIKPRIKSSADEESELPAQSEDEEEDEEEDDENEEENDDDDELVRGVGRVGELVGNIAPPVHPASGLSA